MTLHNLCPESDLRPGSPAAWGTFPSAVHLTTLRSGLSSPFHREAFQS